MAQLEKSLGDVLADFGMVTPDRWRQAQEEEARTGNSAWRVLLDSGEVSERDLVKARAVQTGVGYADVRDEIPAPDALAPIRQDVARRQAVLPLRLHEGVLVVAMAEPNNHLALEELTSLSGKRIVPVAAFRPDLLDAVERAYMVTGHEAPAPAPPAAPPPGNLAPVASPPPGAPSAGGPPAEAPPAAPPRVEVPEEQEQGKDPSLANFMTTLIEKGGSDLHLTAGLPPMIRVHGEVRRIEGYRALMPTDLREMMYGVLTQKQRETFEEEHELDVSYQLPGRGRFRVNIFQQRDSVGAVMRLIPFEIKSLEDLGLPAAVTGMTNLRRGLVLVTGITGSGKSTTLAGMIDLINTTRAEHIMTVEDPIEFLHEHKRSIVNQREVGSDTKSFGEALRHVLRQDPDVILVGEMRDLETIQTALTAAETGHLVFGTLHTQDAPQSIDRVIDVFPPHQQQQIRVQLAGTVAGVVSQQLLPLAGKPGRAVAAEILVATPAVRNLVREGKTHQIYTSMQAGGKHGMQVMDQHLAELVKRGTITYEMGLERSHHVEEYNRLTGKA